MPGCDVCTELDGAIDLERARLGDFLDWFPRQPHDLRWYRYLMALAAEARHFRFTHAETVVDAK